MPFYIFSNNRLILQKIKSFPVALILFPLSFPPIFDGNIGTKHTHHVKKLSYSRVTG
ncbi:hypothetical protein Runsl_4715 [Runella slithyformis DSM 19594]|uniref:Uncharacterized protein n=1 Tax=Runella slithyformis (strain ATCC 29530 / DSM 19594 / LMG 11500 / NCIMB 11436 / LSU 4) TaxID=761193 RepID=A0A7U4E7V2_RUNSL|nr:hypothetical protein Runsl_4715 [Runella slithyformis DSM 19594]